jgi:hypothetical protein
MTGPFFKFFRCSNDFVLQKAYFAVNASLRCLNNDQLLIFVFPANHKWIDKSGLACCLYCTKSSWRCIGCFPPALA